MKNKVLFITVFIIATLLFLAHFWIVGKAVYGDGRYYYSYLPAVFINHTLDFSKIYPHFDIPKWQLTPEHIPANKYSFGPALFWSLPYIFSYGISFLFQAKDPFAIYLQIPVGLWTVALAVVGLYFLWRGLLFLFSKKTATITSISIFFATNILFYGSVDVLNSHAITFFLSSLLLYLWLKKPSIITEILQGVCIGLLMLTRLQEAVFLILPLSTLFLQKRKSIFFTFFSAVAAFLPQIFIWHGIWGTWFQSPYLRAETFDFLHPQILGVLLSDANGLVMWTPIISFAIVGLFLFVKKNITQGVPLLLIFLSELYIIASWSTWWQGASFSGRMFVSSAPIFAIGLGYLFEKHAFKKLRYILVGLFSLLNILLIFYFLLRK